MSCSGPPQHSILSFLSLKLTGMLGTRFVARLRGDRLDHASNMSQHIDSPGFELGPSISEPKNDSQYKNMRWDIKSCCPVKGNCQKLGEKALAPRSIPPCPSKPVKGMKSKATLPFGPPAESFEDETKTFEEAVFHFLPLENRTQWMQPNRFPDLTVFQVGYFKKAHQHSVERRDLDEGILIYCVDGKGQLLFCPPQVQQLVEIFICELLLDLTLRQRHRHIHP